LPTSETPVSKAIAAQSLQQNDEKSTDQTSCLTKEVLIPLKIDTGVGRRSNIIKPDDYFARTHLIKLLAGARIPEDQLTNFPELSYAQFCQIHKISLRYTCALVLLNSLS
jgi:hypothetical protein